MQFGACADIDKAGLLGSVGFDFIEIPLNRVAAMGDDEYREYRDAATAAPVPARVFNCFFPKELRLTGPDVSTSAIGEYVGLALDRMDALGGETLVFGSGGSRRVPDGFSFDHARDQLLDMLNTVGDAASAHGIVIAVEPLRPAESNILNSVTEALDLVRDLDHSSVRLLADFYHMSQAQEDLSAIGAAGSAVLHHIHIAEPESRRWPAPEDSEHYERFMDELAGIGYNRTMSVEGRTQNMKRDAPQALACLKGLWETE
jgi:sugar phosphate isomerase/epimerase